MQQDDHPGRSDQQEEQPSHGGYGMTNTNDSNDSDADSDSDTRSDVSLNSDTDKEGESSVATGSLQTANLKAAADRAQHTGRLPRMGHFGGKRKLQQTLDGEPEGDDITQRDVNSPSDLKLSEESERGPVTSSPPCAEEKAEDYDEAFATEGVELLSDGGPATCQAEPQVDRGDVVTCTPQDEDTISADYDSDGTQFAEEDFVVRPMPWILVMKLKRPDLFW
ncbi:hypothetical protein QBC44DRAFT_310190 [Cladorrhinum sp. PSN332]|nr:hypothetical protein QBC44DRAFT_310190 [Cladorrhinum sp. PSN332]